MTMPPIAQAGSVVELVLFLGPVLFLLGALASKKVKERRAREQAGEKAAEPARDDVPDEH